MGNVLLSIAALVVIALIVAAIGWMLQSRGPKHASNDSPTAKDIGAVTGILGGDIKGAAVEQYALQQKENATGEKATFRDAAMVAAMQQSAKKASSGNKANPLN